MVSFIRAEEINETSPYKVMQVDDLSVRFTTNSNVRYLVGFTPDSFIFDEGGFDFYIINSDEPSAPDTLLFETIIAVIENLFRNVQDSAMIYICAPDNNQQAARARLFKIWFNKSNNSAYTLQTYDSIADDGTPYFYGLILRKDNPFHDEMIKTFLDFLADY